MTVVLLLILAGGVVAAALVRKRPELFWPLLIGLPIATAGFMIAGYAVVDEYLTAAIVAGGLLVAKEEPPPPGRKEKTPLHVWVFSITAAYLVLESMRGTLFLGDVKVLRWVAYYLMFGALLYVLRTRRFPFPPAIQAAKTAAAASSVYFGTYFASGLFLECIRGLPRWSLQGTFFAGSSYAMFPLLLSFPSAFFLLKSGDKRARRLGWVALAISVLVAGYYESRVGWLAIAGMSLFAPLVLGFRRGLIALMGIVAISMLTFWTTYWLIHDYWSQHAGLATPYCYTLSTGERTPEEILGRLFEIKRYKEQAVVFADGIAATVISPVSSRVTDKDREIQTEAGFRTATENPLRLLFGGGTYSHRSLLRAPLNALYKEKLPGVEAGPVVRTTGLSALAVDFGLIGLALLGLNLALVARALVAGRSLLEWKGVSILLFALLLIPLWLTISNVQDMVAYFLLFMPQNLFTLLKADQ